ncbi:glycogen debranching protein [Arthrobacter sp. AQ5-05]|uniref:amylo-alpha-1,6-glucosidase n=1 Tax=Arthrobacter sp. AQ5-05 TaxID=2184581 RepID=UPI000DCC6CA4|nr:glycogen debranching protein [Arthrobacter sp. AQ5-05]RAX49516.1 glycogen debranching protein [Arthrobacter sp. AQ5-05]
MPIPTETTSARENLEAAGGHLDLVQAPFTLPRSRLIIFAQDEGLRVCTSEYEKRLAECVVFENLRVHGTDGRVLPVTRVLPHVIEFGGGAATLSFAGPAALSIGTGTRHRGPVAVHWETPDGTEQSMALGDGPADSIRFTIDTDRRAVATHADRHAAQVAATEAIWLQWFAKCPEVREDLRDMAAFCWWVLGANIVEMPALGSARAVVPSKIGYVGLWQWDAYFIAVGLRHGDPELAREQLSLAFGFPREDGQLPDVVHELGILATSDDLPASDRETLRRAGSAIADPSAPVPLTKPPLAAWALRKVLEVQPAESFGGEDWVDAQLETLRRSQDWWFAASDLDGDGMPEYGHPYSSGLDDSPIFDGPLPTTAPDLGAYLVLQDLELAGFAERLGREGWQALARKHRSRATRTQELLLGMWDEPSGFFQARAAGEPVSSLAVVGLMPLLTGSLPEPIKQRMLGDLENPDRFGTQWSIPTVAADDANFSTERMWRGPVWINTNSLVIEGLRNSGESERARALAEQTVKLVIHGGGPHEYFNPVTGQKAKTATTAFGWSAALFIDLAVQLSTSERW